MTSITFNPITYANKLKEAGMATKVADVQAEEMVNMMNDSLATKHDLRIMELELKGFIVKSLITAIGILATVQGLLSYFIK